MASKADFTEAEWETLGQAVTGAGMLVALSDRGFFDSFKEANALAKHQADTHAHSDNELVREIAETHSRPYGLTSSPAEVEQGTLDALHAAVTLLQTKAPDDLPAYRQLVLEVAQSVAEAAKGVAPSETKALDTIRTALSGPEQQG
jgi:hypothetical protein